MLDGPPRIPEVRIRQAQVAEIGPLAAPVTDLPADLQRLLVVLDGPPRIPET